MSFGFHNYGHPGMDAPDTTMLSYESEFPPYPIERSSFAEPSTVENSEEHAIVSKKRKGASGDAAELCPPAESLDLAQQNKYYNFPDFLHDYDADEIPDEQNQFTLAEAKEHNAGKKDTQPRMSELINIVASKETSLKYDYGTGCFQVIDGPQFEKDYCALRMTRIKKNQAAPDRPFAQMYRAYTMVQGEKWASTGTVFKPKRPEIAPNYKGPSPTGSDAPCTDQSSISPPSHVQSPPLEVGTSDFSPEPPPSYPEATISAEKVAIAIRDWDGNVVDCSLQHFLDVTGAGELYKTSMAQQRHRPTHAASTLHPAVMNYPPGMSS